MTEQCERRREDENWWICDRCGSLWTVQMMGEWRPLSCPEKATVERRVTGDSSPIFNSLTPAQQRHCEFMGFDPDNPDVPLD